MDAIKDGATQSDVRNYTKYEICETTHLFLGGHWKQLKVYDNDLVEKNCSIGEIWDASMYLYWHALGDICQGL